MANILPPPPLNVVETDTYLWKDWFRKLYVYLSTLNTSGGATVVSGTTTVNFGTGKTDVSVLVASVGIVAGSVPKAWVFPAATASNTIDNHWLEDLEVYAGNVVAGVGFTIYVKCNTGSAHGIFNIGWEYL